MVLKFIQSNLTLIQKMFSIRAKAFSCTYVQKRREVVIGRQNGSAINVFVFLLILFECDTVRGSHLARILINTKHCIVVLENFPQIAVQVSTKPIPSQKI